MGAQRVGTVELWIAFVLAIAPLIGYVLGRFAKEELAPGKKWFTLAKRVLFVAVIAVFLFAHKWQLWHVVIGLTFLFAYLAYKPFRAWWLVQAVLALAFVLTSTHAFQTMLAFLSASLIFLYGLPIGAILARKKNIAAPLLAGAVFFGVAAAVGHFL